MTGVQTCALPISIVGGLMTLRDTADKVELTDEQRKRVAERNAEMDAKESKDR